MLLRTLVTEGGSYWNIEGNIILNKAIFLDH